MKRQITRRYSDMSRAVALHLTRRLLVATPGNISLSEAYSSIGALPRAARADLILDLTTGVYTVRRILPRKYREEQ